jgi:hypothetical protein
MAASSKPQASSKEKPPCPRCHRNDNVYYADPADPARATLDPNDALIDYRLDRLDARRATLLARRAATADGYVGKRTGFCFFSVGGDTTMYACNRKH